MLIASAFDVKVSEFIAREFPGLALTHWQIEAKSRVSVEQCCPVGQPFRRPQPYGKYEVTLTLEEAPPSVVAAMVAAAGAK